MRSKDALALARQALYEHLVKTGRKPPPEVLEGWLVSYGPDGTDWVIDICYAPPSKNPEAGLEEDLLGPPTQIMMTIRVTRDGMVTLEESPDILW